MKLEMKVDEHDYAHLHDVFYDATYCEETKEGKSLSNEEIDELIEKLPAHIKGEAFAWGFSDTVVRDNIYVWYQKTGRNG